MEPFSIEGEEVSHSPRTQPNNQPQPEVDSYEVYKMGSETVSESKNEGQDRFENRNQNGNQQPEGRTRFCSIAFYEKFFNVSQEEVIERIKLNFIPFKRDFMEKAGGNPDFYGPLWIMTTIIFLLGSTSNLSRYFQNWEKSEYIFKLQLVRYGVVLIYLIGFGVPCILHLVLRFMRCDTISLPQLICIYGYSFGCFILVFLLCIIPWGWLHWLLMIYGMVNSIAFLVLNLSEHLQQLEKKSYVIFGIIGAAQIFLFLMFKMVFFDLVYEGDGE